MLKALHYDLESLSPDELRMWMASLVRVETEVRKQYEEIIREIPAEWNKYCHALNHFFSDVTRWTVPKGKPGAPDKNALAGRVFELRQSGKSFPQIVNELKKTGIDTTPDALRQLVKRHSKPNKI
jgi:hypothetical protein